MLVNAGAKVIKKGTVTSIADVSCTNGYTIYVFQGSLSPNDILLKYSGPTSKRIRTPKHVHWAVDLLLKKENKPLITNAFLIDVQNMWNSCSPLTGNSFSDINSFINGCFSSFKHSKYVSLDTFGEYPSDFLFVLLSLLAVQEKTNATANGTTAVMFGNVVSELLKSKLDIFKIMSTAGFGGR